MAPLFHRYIGIDYSGAQTPTSSLKGLRVYVAGREGEPVEVLAPVGPKRYWTRRGVAEWLAQTLAAGEPAIVGIDHGFSFPLAYFERYGLARDWPAFLDDFQLHWPTDGDHMYVDFVRDGSHGRGGERVGDTRWRRLTERRSGAAKSVFHFDVQGSVAKSTHSGLPWLRYLRQQLGERVQFWPFDGWSPRRGCCVIAEVYPRLWSPGFAAGERTSDQHDAWVVAEWMRREDGVGELGRWFSPRVGEGERRVAEVEGWILGVG